MAVDGLEVSRLVISKPQALLEILDHLLNLPPFGVVFDHIDCWQMDTGRDQIVGFFAFFFHHDHGDCAQVFDDSDEFGNLDGFLFAVQWQADLPIGPWVCLKVRELGSFTVEDNDRVGLKLRDHVIASAPTDLNQFLCPIPTIGDNIEFAREGKLKISDHVFGNGYFGTKATASFGSLRMIESGPKGQKKVLVNQGRKDPLVTKDIGPIVSMVLVPRAAGDLFPTLLGDGIIDNEKGHTTGSDSKGIEELPQGGLGQVLVGPGVLAEESGEA